MPHPLRIAYLGNFGPAHSTENHGARALEALGHTVIRLQEGDAAGRNGLGPDDLTRALMGMDPPDLLLFTRTWGHTLTLEHLSWLERWGIPTVAWHLDLYVDIERGGPRDPKSWHNIGDDPFWRCAWVFSPDGDPYSEAFFEARGINHRWLLPGVVADECTVEDVPLSRDVLFVGSGPEYHPEWSYRGELLGWLQRTYPGRFEHHGARGRAVRGTDLNRLYASARCAVGDSLVPMLSDGSRRRGWYCSDRRYEAAGRGAVTVQPRIEGIDDGFTDGVNTLFYDFGDWAALKDRVDWLIDDTNAAERELMRKRGHELIRSRHTYTHRMTQMLDVLRAEAVIP